MKKVVCQLCSEMTEAMSKTEVLKAVKEVGDWQLSKDGKNISRQYVMKNFMAAVKLMNAVAAVAQEHDHHPDFHLTGYRNLQIDLSTHKVGGLTASDFTVAAEINKLPAKLKVAKG